jgi:predicted nucleotidyltransferase
MARSRSEVISSAQKYGELLSTLFDDVEVRLFGSYHHNNANQHSDIDLAVISSDFADMDYMLSLKLLNRLKVNIDVEIEPISLTPEEFQHPELGSIASVIAKDSVLIFKS